MTKRVANHDVPGAAHERELQVAHQANDVVNVLRRKKHGGLVVDFLSRAGICKRHQHRSCTTSAIVDGDPAVPLYTRLEVCAGDLGHHTADIIGREKLSSVVIAQIKRHVKLTEKVLVRVKIHTNHDLLEHLREFEHFFGLVLSGNRHVRLFALSGLTPVNGI